MLPNPAKFYVNETIQRFLDRRLLHLRKEDYSRRAEEADLERGAKEVMKDGMAVLSAERS